MVIYIFDGAPLSLPKFQRAPRSLQFKKGCRPGKDRKKERKGKKTPARHKEKTEARDILPEDMTLLKSVEKAVASVSALPVALKTEVRVSESSLWGRRGSEGKKKKGEKGCQVQ